MPPGRLPFDPDIKLIHRQASLKRYAAKSRALKPLSDAQIVAKKESAARYREKHREDIRIKDRHYQQQKAVAARRHVKGVFRETPGPITCYCAKDWLNRESNPGPSRIMMSPAVETPGVFGLYGIQARDLIDNNRPTAPHRPQQQVISNAERSRRQLEWAQLSSQSQSNPNRGGGKQPKPLNLDEEIGPMPRTVWFRRRSHVGVTKAALIALVQVTKAVTSNSFPPYTMQIYQAGAPAYTQMLSELSIRTRCGAAALHKYIDTAASAAPLSGDESGDESDDDDEVPALISEKELGALEMWSVKRAKSRAKL
ncbi:hypothetical protein C8R43DRAFT_960461 [Mycena crocata]|nr:hypothetical protein C8R43DRAFT_960461 [Mycena crocata]